MAMSVPVEADEPLGADHGPGHAERLDVTMHSRQFCPAVKVSLLIGMWQTVILVGVLLDPFDDGKDVKLKVEISDLQQPVHPIGWRIGSFDLTNG